jgi:hypothetical protein
MTTDPRWRWKSWPIAVDEGRHQRGAIPLHHRVMAEVVAVDCKDELAASGCRAVGVRRMQRMAPTGKLRRTGL